MPSWRWILRALRLPAGNTHIRFCRVACDDSRRAQKSRLKGGCRQDCLPHKAQHYPNLPCILAVNRAMVTIARWCVPSPHFSFSSQASTLKLTRRPSTPTTSAVNATVMPIGAAARWQTSTCVPAVSCPAPSKGSRAPRQGRSTQPIIHGVASTRAPSMPRKSMATSLSTSSFFSSFVPIAISAMSALQPSQHAAHVTERVLHARQRIVSVDFVLQIHTASITHLLELLEDAHNRHDALAHIALEGVRLERPQVFDVHVEQAAARLGNGPDHIGARARRVPHVHAQAAARVHVPHRLQHGLRRRILLVFGTVIVDGNADVVLLDEALDGAKVAVRGGADDHGHAAHPGIFEVAADIVRIVLRQRDVAAAHDGEAGALEFLPSAVELFRTAAIRQVKLLDADIRRAQFFDAPDGQGAAVLAQGVAGHAQLDRAGGLVSGGGAGRRSQARQSGGRQEAAAIQFEAHDGTILHCGGYGERVRGTRAGRDAGRAQTRGLPHNYSPTTLSADRSES